jgi:hypothetical protein
MKGARALVCAAAGIIVLLCAALVAAEDFSADMVSKDRSGTHKGKIFVSQDKIRMEIPEAVTITRMDKKIAWILMPQQKMYMEQPLQPGNQVPTSGKMDGELERKPLGTESLGSQLADKYQVTYKQGGAKETVFQWFVKGISIPVKTAAVDNSWSMEYKNIKTGRQSDSLFEVPADYQNFSAQMPSMKDLF